MCYFFRPTIRTVFLTILLAGWLLPVKASQDSEPSERQHANFSDFPDAQVVTDWNELLLSTAAEFDGFQTLFSNRAIPLMHLAIHDALNAIVPVYDHYAYENTANDAHPIAAASQAAHDVMVEIFPDHAQSAAKLHQKWLERAPEGRNKEKGIRIGSESAKTILDLRKDDGHDLTREFIPDDAPGSYQITPPFEEPIGTGWLEAEPLAMASSDQFRPGPPPALDSDVYAREFQEVKRLGRKNSEERTDDQTHIGYWFAEYTTVGYPDFFRTYVLAEDINLWRAARIFALLAIDNYDGLISVFDAKYTYNFWRPYTAIRNADLDGNPATETDQDWEPQMTTAPHPDYPAALSTLCAGGAEVLKDFFGSSDIPYKREAGTVPEGTPAERAYSSIDEAVEHCMLSRIYNGFHFRTGLVVGTEMGIERAQYMLENHLTSRPGKDYPELADF